MLIACRRAMMRNCYAPINGKSHPPTCMGNTLGVSRGFVLISVPHGWGIVLQVTAFIHLATGQRNCKVTTDNCI